MALDFPSAPTVGQHYPQPPVTGQPVYTWDGEKWTASGGQIVNGSPATATPLMDGVAAVGVAVKYAREDHVHPMAQLRGHLAGLTLSTAGSSATFGIAAGAATDSTNADVMVLASAFTKTTGAWAVGTGNGALDTGTIANGTWYHVHEIKRPDTGLVDIAISTSAAYTRSRRIGSMRTNASAQWVAFIQTGDKFTWSTPSPDIAVTNPGTSAVTRTMNTPLGVIVEGLFGIGVSAPAQTDDPGSILLSDLACADVAPLLTNGFSIAPYSSTSPMNNGGQVYVNTNTSSQIRSRVQLSGASTQILINTHGWNDRRGRDT
jgi:hypothetical protein